ncbi:hypothetical protein AGABI1DRAFT_89804 [Agaricus bisporus var. burnettii JB137-S8]|uniref:Uncharacterized protein n=1 Tax=Agaricus bisporus var. burnettii (strain JB137-S8 / ATCC MYA-4627 / FGSC 10392) TaxID=597362 RepID=K5W8N6_AGABU|nr:uncharacterized protein AGABI1DRAFT_89804 [Agaricus bisporus var. burnettii JB137-S8]EKM83229.1 hypothetical protein AGABI1DRAFT_89804 [Agaricus bisporus var. burnettii JB137-S8]
MTMHPELEEAFNMGLSMPEVFKLFTKHHSGPKEERIDIDSYTIPDELVHADDEFWDDWRPSSYPPYRRILARELVDNPGILELSTHTRFRKLIHEPWKALRESHPQYITTPPVLVLFLSKLEFIKWDEELLRSIYEFGSSQHSSPLLWIISIDTNLKLAIQDLLHPFPPFRYSRLPVSYKEGPADAALILHHRFSALRDKHKNMFDEDEVWPSEKQMSQLIMIVSGVVVFVDVIIQFIDWKDGGGPKSHLETFLAYMIDSPSPSNESPCCALDLFYMRALSEIPPDLLPLFKQASSIIYSENFFGDIFELSLAFLLSLGKDALLNVLPHVYRLIWVRATSHSNQAIGYFLADPMRSRQFYAPQSESYLCLYQTFLHILRHASNHIAMLKPMVQETQASAKSYWSVIEDLRHIASTGFCDIKLASDQPLLVSTPLRHFDFRLLAHTCDKIGLIEFMSFFRILYTWSSSRKLTNQILFASGLILKPWDCLRTNPMEQKFKDGFVFTPQCQIVSGHAVRALEASDIPGSEGTFVEEYSENEIR